MSTWYKTGTVDVTNGSTTVPGTGTAWSANVKVGEEFRLSAGQRGYEIIAVVSDTELTIAPAYTGTTQTGQDYVIVPVRGILKSAYDALQSAIAAFNGYLDGPLSGLFGAGTAGAPGIANEGDTDTGMHWPAPGEMAVASNGADVARFHSGGMELTGLLSGTAVQQSATDTTEGRALLNGAHGLGAKALPSWAGDIFQDSATAIYYVRPVSSSGAADMPFESNWNVIKFQRGVDYQAALAIQQGAGAPEVYVGLLHNGVQGDWAELYHSGNIVGTVSQSGGTPTGSVVEAGSNANGDYVRLADGTQICWAVSPVIVSDDFTSGDLFGGLAVLDFPATFAAAPTVTTSAQREEGAHIHYSLVGSGGYGINGFVAYVISNAASTDSAKVHYTAIGRWY